MGRLGVLFLFVSATVSMAAEASPGMAARQWRESRERAILDEFAGLLRIPNTAGDTANIQRNAQYIARMFQRRGVTTRLLEIEDAPPVVYGELGSDEDAETLVFYAHYDGRPVQPSEWHTGDPFRPTLVSGTFVSGGRAIPLPNPGWPTDPEWRLYGRSANDDKAAIMALATALDALRSRGVPLGSNLRFFFEGEEESGSPHLERYLKEHQEQLRGDLLLFLDGVMHESGQQQIAFGARGQAGLELTVYGPRRDAPIAQYSSWAPNPALMLARLLATMKDEDGRVRIDGFYDDVVELEETAREALEAAPDYSARLRRELWLARAESDVDHFEEAVNLPGLNVRGLASGAVGEQARSFIPATASASLDIQLVKGMDHQRTVRRVIEHIRSQGFFVVENEPGEQVRSAHAQVAKVTQLPGYNAVRTSMDLDIARRAVAAVAQVRGPVIQLPTVGESEPLHLFEEVLATPVLLVPIANYDGNRHGHNENLRLQNLWDGIETMAALLALPPPPVEETVSRR